MTNERLELIGQMMANLCDNLSQRRHDIPVKYRNDMRRLYREWDEERKKLQEQQEVGAKSPQG